MKSVLNGGGDDAGLCFPLSIILLLSPPCYFVALLFCLLFKQQLFSFLFSMLYLPFAGASWSLVSSVHERS